MAVSKVVYGTTVLVDLTEDTVTAETLATGVTAHNAAGEKVTGTYEASSGGTSDYIVFQKELKYTTKLTSGRQTLLTQQELVDAGIIPKTSKLLTDVWDEYIIEFVANPSSFTHSTKQVLWVYGSNRGINYTYADENTCYYRQVKYHNTSQTSVSTTQNASPVTTSATGQIYVSSSYGITYTPSSTYGLGVGNYLLRVCVWGRK